MTGHDHADVPEDDLHAYVDGTLPHARAAEVEAWLARNPNAAAEVAAWRSQNDGIRSLFGTTPHDGALDPQFAAVFARPKFNWVAAVAAASVLLAVGMGIGAVANQYVRGATPGLVALESLPGASRTNYLVYAGEVRHPVEVRADEEDHLVAWLSKRLGSKLPSPDLSSQGFSLIGGRLVSFAGGPGALLMYEDPQGKRITLLVGRNEANNRTGFQFDKEGDVQTFYWIDGPLGYALSGDIQRTQLEALAREVYDQL